MPVNVADLVATFRYDDRQAVAGERRINQSIERTAQKAKQLADAMARGGSGRPGASPVERQQAALARELAAAQAKLAEALRGGGREAQAAAAKFQLLSEAERRSLAAVKEATSAYNQRGSSLKRFGESMKGVGVGLSLGVTAPLVALGATAIRTFGTMEQNLNVFQAATGASATQMERMSGLAKQLGADMNLPATSSADAARAMVELGKAGLSVDNVAGSLRSTLQLAATEGIDVAQAANFAANALNAFRLSGDQLGVVVDQLAAGAKASSASVSGMQDSFSQASAVFAQVGLTTGDLVTSLSLLASAGVRGSDAGTSLRVMMGRLSPQSKQAAAAMKLLGVSAYDAQGQLKPLRTIISDFSQALRRFTPQAQRDLLKVIFGEDAQRAAGILFRSADAFDKMAGAVNQQGAAAEMAAARNRGLLGALDAMQSAFESAAGAAIETVARDLSVLARAVGEALNMFANLPAPVRRAVVILAALAATAGPLILVAGNLVTAWGALITRFPALAVASSKATGALRTVGQALLAAPGWTKVAVVAVGAMVLAWEKDFLGIRSKISEFVRWVSPTILDTWNFVKDETSAIFSAMLDGFRSFVQDAKDTFTGLGQMIGEALAAPFAGLSDMLKGLGPQVQTALAAVFKNTPLGQLVGGAQAFAERFTQYTNLRHHAQQTWDQGLLNPKNQRAAGARGSRGAPPVPSGRQGYDPLEGLKKKTKELTPLQQEMQQLQGRLNTAWAVQDALLGNLNPKVAELAGQYRTVYAEGAAGVKKLKEVIGAEEDAARALAQIRTEANVMAAEKSLQKALSAPDRLRQFKEQMHDLQLQVKELSGDDPGGLLRLKDAFGDIVSDAELRRMIEARSAVADLQKVASGWQQYNQLKFEMEKVFKADEAGTFVYTPEQRQAMMLFNREWEKLDKNQRKAGANFVTWGRIMNNNLEVQRRYEQTQQNLVSAVVRSDFALEDAKDSLLAFTEGGDLGRTALELLGVRLSQLPSSARESVTATLKEMMRIQELGQVFETLVGGIQDVFRRGFEDLANEGFGGFFKSVYQGFRQLLIQMAAEFLSSQIRNVLMNAIGGLFTKAANWHPPMASRQFGGPVAAGGIYPVGERGPELFVPRQSGQIMNRHQIAGLGGGATNVTINLHGVTDFASFRRNEAQIHGSAVQMGERINRRNRGG